MEQQNWKRRMIAYINALDNEKLKKRVLAGQILFLCIGNYFAEDRMYSH